MKRFVEGADRHQATLLPECLEDWVSDDNPVRVIDAFVDELDLGALGFPPVAPKATVPALLSPVSAVRALRLRLSQPRPIKPPS